MTLKISPLDPLGKNLPKWSLNCFCSSDSLSDIKTFSTSELSMEEIGVMPNITYEPFKSTDSLLLIFGSVWSYLRSRSMTLKFAPLDPQGPNLQKWSLNRFCSSGSLGDIKENM